MLDSSDTENDELSEIEQKIEKENWDIKPEDEKKFWMEHIINEYTYQPEICPTCSKGKLNLKENNKNNLMNPYLLVCNNRKCKKNYPKKIFTIFFKS